MTSRARCQGTCRGRSSVSSGAPHSPLTSFPCPGPFRPFQRASLSLHACVRQLEAHPFESAPRQNPRELETAAIGGCTWKLRSRAGRLGIMCPKCLSCGLLQPASPTLRPLVLHPTLPCSVPGLCPLHLHDEVIVTVAVQPLDGLLRIVPAHTHPETSRPPTCPLRARNRPLPRTELETPPAVVGDERKALRLESVHVLRQEDALQAAALAEEIL